MQEPQEVTAENVKDDSIADPYPTSLHQENITNRKENVTNGVNVTVEENITADFITDQYLHFQSQDFIPTSILQDDITNKDEIGNNNPMAVTQITILQELFDVTDENVKNITITDQYETTLLQEDFTNAQQLGVETEGYIN